MDDDYQKLAVKHEFWSHPDSPHATTTAHTQAVVEVFKASRPGLCNGVIVISTLGAAACDRPKGHTGDCDTTAFDEDIT